MPEPISTTAAAAASAAQTTATATAAGAGAGAGAATTEAAKVEILRKLAFSMLQTSETTVLNQSELVDEFATPIYTGLSAANAKLASTPGTPSVATPQDNSTPSVATPQDNISLSNDKNASINDNSPSRCFDPTPFDPTDDPPPYIVRSSSPISEKPEIKQLIDDHRQFKLERYQSVFCVLKSIPPPIPGIIFPIFSPLPPKSLLCSSSI